MNLKFDTIEEVQVALEMLRSNPGTRRKFPKQIWDSIIRLTQMYSIKEICRRLNIDRAYLSRKIPQSRNVEQVDFQEISLHSQNVRSDVVIELFSVSGLRAKIQGPSSCLTCLQSLFRE